jgi:hypothetical protein
MKKIEKLLVGVSFYFLKERLKYLKQIFSHFKFFSDNLDLCIFTNTENEEDHLLIRELSDDFKPQIFVPSLLGHPYLLCWAHLAIFRSRFLNDTTISHYLYLEDDIEIRKENIVYWLNAREHLRGYNLIPSFVRYELLQGDPNPFSVEITKRFSLEQLRTIKYSEKYYYINLPNPYQGMYFLDRELAKEHFFGKSSSPDYGIWNIRERAAQGLTFLNVPKNFFSRNLVGYDFSKKCIDSNALIHHLSNNYVNNPNTKSGKIYIKDIVKR